MSELPRDLDLVREVEHGELAVVLQRLGVTSASRFSRSSKRALQTVFPFFLTCGRHFPYCLSHDTPM
jgi:hypothetical protein